jgi:hypothetical protein
LLHKEQITPRAASLRHIQQQLGSSEEFQRARLWRTETMQECESTERAKDSGKPRMQKAKRCEQPTRGRQKLQRGESCKPSTGKVPESH